MKIASKSCYGQFSKRRGKKILRFERLTMSNSAIFIPIFLPPPPKSITKCFEKTEFCTKVKSK